MNILVNDNDKNSGSYLLNELNRKIDKLKNFNNNEIDFMESKDNIEADETTTNLYGANHKNYDLKKIHNLQTLSICQLCKNTFNFNKNLPLLFKCGHFFCKECIIKISKQNNNRITCPEDGYIEKFLQDLKVLKNLINDNDSLNLHSQYKKEEENKINFMINKDISQFCRIHPNERLNYYCHNSDELLCVYCAFDLYRGNNQLKMMDMNEKCNDIIFSVNEMLEQNENFIRSLRQSLSEMKKNKIEEENRINNYFKELHSLIEEKRQNLIKYVGVIFSQNSEKIEQKFDFFIKKMQDAEIIKHNIDLYLRNQTTDANKILNSFNNFVKENKSDQLEILQVKFLTKNTESEDILHKFFEIKLHTKFINSGSKYKIPNTDNHTLKNSLPNDGKNSLYDGSRSLRHNKSSSYLETKGLRKQMRDTDIYESKFVTPLIKTDVPNSIRITGKEIIDTVELLEENENQNVLIQQQFNFKK